MANIHPLCIALYHYLLLVLKVTILVKNTSKTCLQLSKMPPKRGKFSDYDKIASLIDSVFDSENDERDIDIDNECIDNTTSSCSSSSGIESNSELVKPENRCVSKNNSEWEWLPKE